MRRVLAVLLLALVVAPAAAAAGPYYWASIETEMRVVNSDWGDARNVEAAMCVGKGKHTNTLGVYRFVTFRCELKDPSYQRIGFVTVNTVGPETWKPTGSIPPRCRK